MSILHFSPLSPGPADKLIFTIFRLQFLFDPPLYLFPHALLLCFFFFLPSLFVLVSLMPPCLNAHQAQRKADSLQQSLSELGDKVKQQTVPNKDIQKEIADMTEVHGIFVL